MLCRGCLGILVLFFGMRWVIRFLILMCLLGRFRLLRAMFGRSGGMVFGMVLILLIVAMLVLIMLLLFEVVIMRMLCFLRVLILVTRRWNRVLMR